MLLPARAVEIINKLYNLNKQLAKGTEDERRALTRTIAEQLCFELGNAWGTKKAGPGNPQSKDSIAYNLGGGIMDVWDWQNGTTREPQVFPNKAPDYPSLTGQYFISVTPTNHLGVDDTPPPQDDNNDLLIAIAELRTHLDTMQIQVSVIEKDTADILKKCQEILDKPIQFPTFPEYELKIFGQTVTLKPKR